MRTSRARAGGGAARAARALAPRDLPAPAAQLPAAESKVQAEAKMAETLYPGPTSGASTNDDMTAFAGMQLEIGKRWVRDARCPAPSGLDPPAAPRRRAPRSPVSSC